MSVFERAENGDVDAQYEVAQMYRYGKGVEQSDKKMMEYLVKASKNGKVAAKFEADLQYRVVQLRYADVSLFSVPNKKAMDWTFYCAELGIGEAQYDLGSYYCQGIGVEKSIEEGVYWMSEAAKNNVADAQYNMALWCHNGALNEEYPGEAEDWCNRAIKNGSEDAKDLLSKIRVKNK